MSEFDHFESALNVQEGIEQPEQVSPYLHLRKKRARTLQPADYYVQGILEGNRVILSQAITLIESVNPTHFQLAQEVIEKCLPYAGKSVRVGITGVPGVGKSTFIEAIGKYLTGIALIRINSDKFDISCVKFSAHLILSSKLMSARAFTSTIFVKPKSLIFRIKSSILS